MKTTIVISDMKCQNCVTAIKNALEGIDGVISMDINLMKKTAVVEHNGLADEVLLKPIVDIGLTPKVRHGLFR